MRKRKRLTLKIESLFEYIEVLLKKDIASKETYTIGIDEFYALWNCALLEKYTNINYLF